MSDSSCKRVLPLSCGQSFPPVFSVVFKNVTGMYEFSSPELWYLSVGVNINFPVFMSKPFSFSTRISEYCVLKSGVL